MPKLCVDSCHTFLKVNAFLSDLMSSYMIIIDGMVMAPLKEDENVAEILEVKCSGLETELNMCITRIPSSDCNRVRLQCRKPASEAYPSTL